MSGATHLFVRDTSNVPSAKKHHQHFFRRLPVQPPVYKTDESDLIPVTTKSGVVQVELADAQKVKISGHKETHTKFNATELPTIRFQGKLKVSEGEDLEVEESVPDVVFEGDSAVLTEVGEQLTDSSELEETDSVRHLHIKTSRVTKNKKKSSKSKKNNKTLLSNPFGVIGMRRGRIEDRNPQDGTLTVAAPVQSRSTRVVYVLAIASVAGFVVTTLLIGMESHVSFSSQSFASSYQFTLNNLVGTLREHFAALIVHSLGI